MKIVSGDKTLEVPGGGQSQEIYSTEEQVVGRWIDGKPLYRKCLDLTVSATQFTITPPIHEKIISMRFTPYGTIEIFDNMARTNTDIIRCWYNRSEDEVYINISADYNVSKIVLILEYTKTTDQATIELPAALKSAPVESSSVSDDIAQAPETSTGDEEIIPSFYDEEV